MRRITTPLLTLLAAVAFMLAAPLVAVGAIEPPPVIIYDPLGSPASSGPPAGGPLTVMLELATPPPDVTAPASVATTQRAAIAGSQRRLLSQLQALQIPVLFQTRAAYSGVAVEVTSEQLAMLRALPEVAGVHVIPPKQRSSASLVDTIGATHFWSTTRQHVLGQGVRIGIIDSGIDYTHATFGGPGTAAAFAANNPAAREEGSFPTAKVVGGVDFVGDGYDASGAEGSTTPAPDDDPLDCSGHGTHVASIAAGYGVDPQGAAYRGLYSASVNFEQFMVQPGIAPEASLVALKIFGCRGTTTYLTQAIDYALDPNGDGDTADRLVDVLNISLGSPFGGESDPDAVAVDRAARAGVVVVVSAGGTDASGDVFYAVSSPATSPLTIAVGASAEDTTVTPPAARVAPFSPRGPSQNSGALKPDLVAPGVGIVAAAAGTGNGSTAMTGTSTAAPQVSGAAALLLQLRPGWAPAQVKAALVNTALPLTTAGGAAYPPSLVGAGRLHVEPLALLDLLVYPSETPAAGGLTYGAPAISQPTTLQRNLTIENIGTFPRTVQLEALTTIGESAVQLNAPAGPFSLPPGGHIEVPVSLAVEPQALTNQPDAATTIQQSAGLYRYYLAERAGYVQVTSSVGARVRIAHVAGIGGVSVTLGGQVLDPLLVRGEVSAYVPASSGPQTIEVRAAHSSDTAPLFVGQVDVSDSHDHTLVLWGAEGRLRLAALTESPSPPPAGTGLVTVHNADPYGDGGAIDVYADSVLMAANVPVGALVQAPVAGGSRTFRVLRAGSSSAAEPIAVRTVTVGINRQFLLSVGKCLVWIRHSDSGANSPQGQQLVRVPFQILPRSASESRASVSAYLVPAGVSAFDIPLGNSGARRAALDNVAPREQVALVSAFALDPLGVSPALASLPPQLRPADIEYVGATSNIASSHDAGSPGTYLYFGIASQAAWDTPNQVEFRVYIDSNLDNDPDYVVLNTSRGALSPSLPNSGPPDDVFVTALYRIPPGQAPQYTGERANWNTLAAPTAPGLATERLDPAPFNTRTLVLAVRASSIGLSAAQPRLRYYVETRARDASSFGIAVDRAPASGLIEYNVAGGAVTPMNLTDPILLERPLFAATEAAGVSTTVNQDVLSERGSQALLLLHHHNTPAQQAEVVVVQSSSPLGLRSNPDQVRVALPMVGEN